MKTLLTAAWVALVLLIPNIVWACPYCAGRDDGDSLLRNLFIGSMILLPFVVVGVGYGVMRRSGLLGSEHTVLMNKPDASKADGDKS